MTLEYYRGCTERLEAQRNELRSALAEARATIAELEDSLGLCAICSKDCKESWLSACSGFLSGAKAKEPQPVDPHCEGCESIETCSRNPMKQEISEWSNYSLRHDDGKHWCCWEAKEPEEGGTAGDALDRATAQFAADDDLQFVVGPMLEHLQSERARVDALEKAIEEQSLVIWKLADGNEEISDEVPTENLHGSCPNCGAGLVRYIRLDSRGHFERKECSSTRQGWDCYSGDWRNVKETRRMDSQEKPEGQTVCRGAGSSDDTGINPPFA